MSIKPSEFLDFAKQCNQTKNEVNFRCSISRAYYSAYHEVLSQLIDPPDLRPSAHDNLIKYLKGKFNDKALPTKYDKVTAGAIANMLAFMRKKRNESDYDLNRNISQMAVDSVILHAENTIEAASKLIINTVATK
ncbi:hypothetical protein [Thorsellia anophelis]|uniref:Uncharacterized protein, contains HEPN domain, UPF0332 family n=1 Tax=Thorsellia anophelis DSM 18579 TaxID=1123402 RepID=A0A1I0D8T5_9GAMM|nr:hypothetical protein [Thorsellia anophelis]SET27946.1 Uncharacterized protein, contains HEPN domain, UPF0332 family [Thorsellia anophelis DSM 18579]